MNKKEILEKTKEMTEDLGYLFIDMDFRGDSRNRILEIYIDKEAGVTVDDCKNVSRAVGDMIEEDGLIVSRYRLDVSSPGIDRPLKFIQQFKRNIGRSFELKLLEDESSSKLEGKLLEVADDDLKFQIKKEIKVINIKKIRSAKVLVRF
ncbi:MAG: ribosome assembly cofactor RimP [Chlorobi bacterium]|nr:ribosome assembly cofactor RimP [Chlorobiota bacterium]